jgi:hypothetical protein
MVRDVEREWIARDPEPGCSWLWILLALLLVLGMSC